MSVHENVVELLNSKNVKYKLLNHKPTTTSEESAKTRGTALNEGLINHKTKNFFSGAKCLLVTNKEV